MKKLTISKIAFIIMTISLGLFAIFVGTNNDYSLKLYNKISHIKYLENTFAFSNEACTCGFGSPVYNCTNQGRCCKCDTAGNPYCDICGGSNPSPPPNPTPAPASNCQVNMTADRTTITQGECTYVRWSTSGYGAAWAHGVSGGLFCCPQGADICSNISQCSSTNCGTCDNKVCPTQTTSYWIRMECNCASHVNCGASTGTITINVNPAPTPTPTPTPTPAPPPCNATLTASANPNPINEGECSTISWSGSNLSRVSLWNGESVLGNSGSRSVCIKTAGTNTYSITGIANSGCTLANPMLNIAVTVKPKSPTVTLTANPVSIIKGNSSALSWSSTNANTLAINQGIGSVTVPSGTKSIFPTTKTTYMITATGSGGTANASASVNVTDPEKPNVTLVANPVVIKEGECSTLTWSSSNANSLSIDQGLGNVTAPSGTKKVCPINTTIYTITANGPGGTSTSNATVAVNKTPVCQSYEAEGTVKFDQNKNQYYLLKDDASTVILTADSTLQIDFQDYLNARVKVTGCIDVNTLRVLSIKKLSDPPPPVRPEVLASLTTLIATGSSLWLNIAIAVIVSVIIGYFILRKRANNNI